MAQPSLATVESVLAPLVAAAPTDARAGSPVPNSHVPNSPCTCIGSPSRSLVVCIDGTSNQFSKYNTNVVELYNRLKKDANQLTYYNSGIGTYAKPSWVSLTYAWQWISSAVDLVFARRIDRSVKQAYQWLSEQYRPGDRIYLFGFSRGAYQVRILAAMIDSVGLLHKGNLDQIPFAYRLYVTSQDDSERSQRSAESSGGGGATPEASPPAAQSTDAAAVADDAQSTTGSQSTSDSEAAPEPEPTTKEVLASFKKAFSHENVRVHFVGVWDTVSSVGIFYNKTLPGTTTGMDHTCFFRHALALHERRVRFLPEYAYGGTGNAPSGTGVEGPENRPADPTNAGDTDSTTPVTTPRIKEVWFQGCHSDIGGGNIRNVKLQHFAPALRWMCFEARTAGLEFNPPPDRKWARRSKVHDSMSCGWSLVEYIPLTHRSYRNTGSGHGETWWRFHLRAPRVISKDQFIHATALPLNTVKKRSLWSILRARRESDSEEPQRPVATFEADSSRTWANLTPDDIEPDHYLDAERAVSFLSSLRDTESLPTLKSDDARFLKVLLSTGPGRLSLRKAARAHPDSTALELLYLLFHDYIHATQPAQDAEQQLALEELRKAAPDVYGMLPRLPHVTRRVPFPETIPALRELPDEGQVAAAKNGIATLPIAVTQTVPLLEDSGGSANIPWIAYTQHQLKLSCVSTAFGLSSRDVGDRGVHLLAPRYDPSTVSRVACAALYSSGDSEHLVTGTSAGLLQEWSVDGKPGRPNVQLEVRHEASDDQLFTRIDHVLDTTKLHWKDAELTCLATSPDGAVLVTAWGHDSKLEDPNRPRTTSLAIYDLKKFPADSTSPFKPFSVRKSAHERRIASVAYSAVGSTILTASWDHTVKIWSVNEQGEIVGDARVFQHNDDVNHAVYSTDGQLIASGSDDCTVIVWDAVVSGAPRQPFRGHKSFVTCVAFSPDASKVISGSLDRTVRLWETETGNQLGVYRSHPDAVTCVTFKPDGSQFASASQDGTVLQWDEWSDSELEEAIKEYRASQKAPKNDTASQT